MPSDKDLPALVRKCWQAAKTANAKNREAEILRLKFYAGGDGQWRDEEITKRKNSGRPWLSINKCKPAVDQIEGDIRLNPPGPQCHPVGDGADKDTADIIEGLIRETEYRSYARTAYSTAGKYVAASGCGYLELETEYTGDRSFAQQLKICSIEDPSCILFDPTARMANRQDAGWAIKLKMYNRPDYIAAFGSNRRVLKDRSMQYAMGWIQEAMGIDGTMAQITEWTGNGNGPFYVAEFWRVETKPVKLRLYSDLIARFDDEDVPEGVTAKSGDEYVRTVPRRKIMKYVIDALEVLMDGTEWYGDLIPIFPVLGPEVYIDGKLHRLSLIAGAMDSQRALNYTATSSAEIAGNMTRAPWIGPKGSFDDPRWQTPNEPWATLEYTPVFITDEQGQQQLAPPPQRNTYEVAVQWLIQLGQWFSDGIKAVTAIYDPSLGQQKGDQSGKAIEQLRSESSVGNYSYADNLHRAIEIMYDQMACIFSQIMDGPRAVTIVKPDSQHEVVQINQVFGQGGIDPKTGKKGKANNICLGQYSVRVTVGPSFETRQEQAIATLTDFFKVNPQALAVPGVAAQYLRMIGAGNPKVEQMADLLAPNTAQDATPQQIAQQLQQSQQQVQAMQQIIQKLQQALMAKMPEVEAKKFATLIDSLTKIRVAEINASKDMDNANADREADAIEQLLNLSHETAMQATEHEHAANQQQDSQAAAMQQQQVAAQQEPAGATQ